ncbi:MULTISPECIES: AtzE family amidohydrolase [Planktothricoides]|uniref:AtzE family amidohydrolase n=2 Tax=Planktothricoides raciborskii TaxID=132608 RepID=A0AAU8JNF0_9CYAN|nr:MULTISPECIES: AtzE family amidohydrolase [Planktothricoides]MBD2545379.1 AtzE family amidohydrolase [Planktothricoides raciborskii FACHB-1370]MBD2583196.1 AtzE family amidohydrolase [Planktothricoides raciborskii FACHB-1261]
MSIDLNNGDAIAISTAVKNQEITAKAVILDTLAQIARKNPPINCFTAITSESAIAQAEAIDQKIATGEDPGLLAGVPFAVKNLFDIAGLTTLAGSKINAENPPATQDAAAISRLKQAGAVLVGALNMDEYAYGFVTENSHYGATKNPRDLTRVAGGSSGGSAAAVAAGLVPISLGSDTNGSIRVPASLCGIFGLKPTYGRLSRAGTFLFSSSLDHIGPFARSVRDIAAVFDLLQGQDPQDSVCTHRDPDPCLPQLNRGIEGLKIAVANDYFAQGGQPEVFAAVAQIANGLNVQQNVTIPAADRARAAAFVITACEGANLHLDRLRSRSRDFDPATRDRFLAGALIPAHWYIQSQRFRQWFRDILREIFQTVDIILAPTTPIVAPKLGQETMAIDGQEILVRPNLGLYTQPLSFIGLPVLSVPIHCRGDRQNNLPFGVQIIAAPYNESLILRVAAYLEAQGIISAPVTHPL